MNFSWGRLDSTESPKGGLPAEVPNFLVNPLGKTETQTTIRMRWLPN